MKQYILFGIFGLAAAIGLTGCGNDPASSTSPGASSPATDPAARTANAPVPPAAGYTGRVRETMNSGGYTYVQVDTGKETLWAAAPPFTVKVGDTVTVPPGMPMQNFHSSTLDRDFDLIHFVNGVTVGGAQPGAVDMTQLPKGHPPIPNGTGQPAVDVSGLQKAPGGQTIAEIYAGKADLTGKEVKVRGKVVKFNANIMDKNWLHLQDGTGGQGSNDLTVTTAAQAKVGDTVLVTGKLATEKDFGYSYQYAVLIEDATVVVE